MDIKANKKNIEILAKAVAGRLSKMELVDLATKTLVKEYSKEKENFKADWKVLFEDS
jgi:glutaredoxin 2